jgi:plasmid stabilization system protein ParE
MRVAWLLQAEDDLQNILDYVKGYSPEKALWLLNTFYDSADQLEQFPQMGQAVPELGREDLRELIIDRKYRLIYKVAQKHIFVLTIKHGRQRWDAYELKQPEVPGE